MKTLRNLFKNKIFLAVLLVVIILGVASFFLLRGGGEDTETDLTDETQDIKQLSAEDLGLTLTPKQNGEVINMRISNVEGISSIEYDLTYDAEVEDAGDTIVIARGVTGGPLEVNGKEVDVDIDLGTCSRNVCKYDTVVSDVTLILRVNFANGEVGGVETTVSLDE